MRKGRTAKITRQIRRVPGTPRTINVSTPPMTRAVTLEDICPDFAEWPRRWMGVKADEIYGQGLLAEMRPFAEQFIARGLSKKTIRRHLENLWLLGGEIIRDVNTVHAYHVPPLAKLLDSIGPDGGPLCRYIDSREGQRSFDTTCRQLHAYLQATRESTASDGRSN
jgi:hypothetical protein